MLRGRERSRFTGACYIFIASFIAFLAFERDIAVLALSFLAVGDATAALVGRYLGRTKVLGKTLEGDLSCFASCLIIGAFFYQAGLSITVPAFAAGAAGATLMESVPLPVNDNLTIPLVSGLIMTLVMFACFT
jgi:glycerol-3-phosphate acyltransferase PlsY